MRKCLKQESHPLHCLRWKWYGQDHRAAGSPACPRVVWCGHKGENEHYCRREMRWPGTLKGDEGKSSSRCHVFLSRRGKSVPVTWNDSGKGNAERERKIPEGFVRCTTWPPSRNKSLREGLRRFPTRGQLCLLFLWAPPCHFIHTRWIICSNVFTQDCMR